MNDIIKTTKNFCIINTTLYNDAKNSTIQFANGYNDLSKLGFNHNDIMRIKHLNVNETLMEFDYPGICVIRLR